MTGLFLAAVMAAASAAAGPVESDEAQASQRLAAHALETLDGILGPGRAKVQVEIRGGGSQTRTESEIVSPLDKSSAAGEAATRILDLPGYTKLRAEARELLPGKKDEGAAGSPTFVQRDHEQSLRETGFEVRQIQATVVLDSALGDDPVREVSQLLPQLLRIDASRGDVLTILRAPMRPAWKSAFATPSDWRAASYAAAGVLSALIAALIVAAAFVRGARALGSELASGRGALEPSPAPAAGIELPLPELVPGGPPGGLLEASAAAGASSPQLLGQRFDFLLSREPSVVARALAAETPEALCLLFGHLASSAPDLASRLFAGLQPAVQAEVSQSLVKLSVADPERLGEIEAKLRRTVENAVEGPQSLAKILSRVPGEARADIFARLAETNARAGEEVQKHVFAFEDLESLSAADLRRLLTAVPYESWGPALRGAPQGVLDRVLADLPEGPRRSVRDEALKPQSREKVAAARSKILDVLFEMAAKGALSIDRSTIGGGLV
ncbi:MAG: hypothetical protein A2V88_11070 [Elusimicrobia bacterium RBG_16_66_12]|nr:MAG: hypothetical protein A2V88_11070 [Elusimicrobia bacterium RBG_16_66_12]